MSLLAGVLHSLAAILFLIFVAVFSSDIRTRNHHGEWTITVSLVLLPMWLLLTSGSSVLVSRGGFAWLGGGSSRQYLLVIGGCVAMLAVSWFTAVIGSEPANDIPWVIRPFLPWPHFVLPPLVLLHAFWTPPIPIAIRGPLSALAVFSLLLCSGMLVELAITLQKEQSAKSVAMVERLNSRDATILAEVEAMDPAKQFGQLLNFTSEYESRQIRTLALQKVLSRPDPKSDMRAAIEAGYASEALRFFASNDLPSQSDIAASVRDAILAQAEHVRRLIRQETSVRNDDFDSRAEECLKAAGKFRNSGVDFAPAIRAFRDALDEPRAAYEKFQPNCRATLDKWLATR